MGYVLDASWARHGWKAVKDAGFTGVSLYLSNDPSKNCKPADVAGVQAAGLHLMLNWESTTGRPKQGAVAGQADAARANAEADALGYPKTCAIYFSCDTDAQPAEVTAYYAAAKAASARPVGAYGGAIVVHTLLINHVIDYAWVANAGSWDHGVGDAGCHLHQHYHTHNHLPVPAGWGLNDYDESVVLIENYGQWGATAPAPKPSEDDVYLYQLKGGDAVYVSDGVVKRHVADPDELGVLQWSLGTKGQSIAPILLTQAQLDKIPDYVSPAAPKPAKVDTAAIAKAVADALASRLAS